MAENGVRQSEFKSYLHQLLHLWEEKEAGWERSHTVIQVLHSLRQPHGEAQVQWPLH